MSPDDIAEIVVAEAFGDCDPDIAKWLRNHPAEWKAALTAKLEGLRLQFERAKADDAAELADLYANKMGREDYEAARADRQAWRASASAVRSALEGRLREVKGLRRGDAKVSRVAKNLRAAIEAHRAASVAGECKPEPYDLELWAALEETA